MVLLLEFGLKQIINYVKTNKLKVLAVALFIFMMIFPYIISSNSLHNESFSIYGTPAISFQAFALVVSAFFILLSFAQGSTLFISKAEANIFFVAPIKEHHILSYIMLKSSYQVVFLVLVFMGTNYSFVRPYFNLDGAQFIMLILWELLLLAVNMYFGIFLFILKKKNKALFYGLLLSVGALVAIPAFLFLFSFHSVWQIGEAFENFFANDLWTYVPLIGWAAGASAMIYGFSAKAAIFLLLMAASIVLFLFSPYYIKTWLAEAAIEAAEKNAKRRERQKHGNKINIEVKSVKTSLDIKMTGAKAIISKQWIEYRRNSKFLMTGTTLTLLLLMTIYAVMYQFIRYTDEINFSEEWIVGVILLVVLILVSMMLPSDISKDATHPAIFLIPEKSMHKLMAISVMSNFENLIKAVLMFFYQLVVDIPIDIALCIAVVYFIVMSMVSCIDMFFHFIFSDGVLNIFKLIFGAFAKVCALLFLVALYAVFTFILNGAGAIQSFNIVSFPALAIVALAALLIDLFMLYAAQGLTRTKE